MTTLQNLCPNPSLEVSAQGWVPTDGATITQTGVTAWSGRYCGLVTTDGLADGEGILSPAWQFADATPVSAQIELAGESGTVTVIFALNPGGIILGQQTVQLTNAWQNITFEGAAVAANDSVYIVVETDGAQALNFYVDACMYEPTATLDAYFDGDSPNASWLGTAGLSASELAEPGALSLHGGMYLLGTVEVIDEGKVVTVAVPDVQATMSGTIAAVTGISPVAALDDFASWESTDNDPAMTYVSWNTAGMLSGQTAYTRPWAIFYPPLDYPDSAGTNLWNRAAFMAIGFEYASVASGIAQNLTCVQAEIMPIAGTDSLDQTPAPSTYDPSRTLHTIIKPTRLNYAQNPAFQVTGSTWAETGNGTLTYDTTVVSPVSGGAYDGQVLSVWTQTGKVAISSGNGGATQTLDGLFTGDTYTASMYVLPGPGVTDFQLTIGNAISPSLATGSDLNPAPPAVTPANTYGNTGTTYYVSPSGYDTNNGLTPQTAFATIARVNELVLAPGDAVLFEGGQTWTGTTLQPGQSGTAINPVIFGSYGTGQATMVNTSGTAIYVYEHGGIVIKNLIITGPGASLSGSQLGINFNRDMAGYAAPVTITGCTITGWAAGILIGAAEAGGGYSGITITNSSISANRDSGINIYGSGYSHKNVTISGNTVYDQTGNSGNTDTSSGHGIVIGNASGGTVSYNIAYGNGENCGCTVAGPVGIWGYTIDSIIFERNVSYQNKTAAPGNSDGDGFDLDDQCVNCTMQYNIAYENDGFGIVGYSSDNTWSGNIIRYNITWGNSVNNPDAAEIAFLGGAFANCQVYANTFIGQTNAQLPSVVLLYSATFSDLYMWNNIFYTASSGVALMYTDTTYTGVTFQGNLYYSASPFVINWGGTSYSSLASWQTDTGQEKLAGNTTGIQADPRLAAPGNAPAVTSKSNLIPAYGLQPVPNSPVIGQGLNLAALYGVNTGSQDVFGNQIPLNAIPWIGASQGFPVPEAGGWMRLQVIFTAPAPTATMTVTAITDPGASFPVNFWTGPTLVEAGEVLGSYFDGGFSDPDYMWETGSTAGVGRSYYYEGYAIQQSVILDILSRHTPLGISYAQPLYAQLPTQ